SEPSCDPEPAPVPVPVVAPADRPMSNQLRMRVVPTVNARIITTTNTPTMASICARQTRVVVARRGENRTVIGGVLPANPPGMSAVAVASPRPMSDVSDAVPSGRLGAGPAHGGHTGWVNGDVGLPGGAEVGWADCDRGGPSGDVGWPTGDVGAPGGDDTGRVDGAPGGGDHAGRTGRIGLSDRIGSAAGRPSSTWMAP